MKSVEQKGLKMNKMLLPSKLEDPVSQSPLVAMDAMRKIQGIKAFSLRLRGAASPPSAVVGMAKKRRQLKKAFNYSLKVECLT